MTQGKGPIQTLERKLAQRRERALQAYTKGWQGQVALSAMFEAIVDAQTPKAQARAEAAFLRALAADAKRSLAYARLCRAVRKVERELEALKAKGGYLTELGHRVPGPH